MPNRTRLACALNLNGLAIENHALIMYREKSPRISEMNLYSLLHSITPNPLVSFFRRYSLGQVSHPCCATQRLLPLSAALPQSHAYG